MAQAIRGRGGSIPMPFWASRRSKETQGIKLSHPPSLGTETSFFSLATQGNNIINRGVVA